MPGHMTIIPFLVLCKCRNALKRAKTTKIKSHINNSISSKMHLAGAYSTVSCLFIWDSPLINQNWLLRTSQSYLKQFRNFFSIFFFNLSRTSYRGARASKNLVIFQWTGFMLSGGGHKYLGGLNLYCMGGQALMLDIPLIQGRG